MVQEVSEEHENNKDDTPVHSIEDVDDIILKYTAYIEEQSKRVQSASKATYATSTERSFSPFPTKPSEEPVVVPINEPTEKEEKKKNLRKQIHQSLLEPIPPPLPNISIQESMPSTVSPGTVFDKSSSEQKTPGFETSVFSNNDEFDTPKQVPVTVIPISQQQILDIEPEENFEEEETGLQVI